MSGSDGDFDSSTFSSPEEEDSNEGEVFSDPEVEQPNEEWLRGPSPYLFQPRRAPEAEMEETDSDSDSGSSSDVPQRLDRTRATIQNWCNCGNCEISTLQREEEAICCQEIEFFSSDMDPHGLHSCITEDVNFWTTCMNRHVLRVTLVSLNHIRGDEYDWENLPNSSYRFAAYRQFTWWAFGHLGRRMRRVLPACVVATIRREFPEEDERYTGFRSTEDD